MAKTFSKKFGWEIENFSCLQYERLYSLPVAIGDYNWRLFVIPKEDDVDGLSLYLEVVDSSQSLPFGWRVYAKFRLSILNQISQELSVHEEGEKWFDQNALGWGFKDMIPLTELHAEDGGFVVNGQMMIFAEIDVLEVVATLDESDEEKAIETPRQKKLDDGANSCDSLNETQQVKESIDVNGFKVLPSQVESVRRIFEKHPDIAVEVHVKNQHLRTSMMNFLLNIIETMCQSLPELTNEDLVDVDIALTYLKDAGFKVDWLEKKLDQVKENKEKEQIDLSKLQELVQQLHDLMHKCEKKSEVLSIRAPLKFDDIV